MILIIKIIVTVIIIVVNIKRIVVISVIIVIIGRPIITIIVIPIIIVIGIRIVIVIVIQTTSARTISFHLSVRPLGSMATRGLSAVFHHLLLDVSARARNLPWASSRAHRAPLRWVGASLPLVVRVRCGVSATVNAAMVRHPKLADRRVGRGIVMVRFVLAKILRRTLLNTD